MLWRACACTIMTYVYVNMWWKRRLCGNGNCVDRKKLRNFVNPPPSRLLFAPSRPSNPHLTRRTTIYWPFNRFPFPLSSLSKRQWIAIIIYDSCVFVAASKFPCGFSRSDTRLVRTASHTVIL